MCLVRQYRARDAPHYRLGHGITLAYICIGLFAAILYKILLTRENRRRDRGERDERILSEHPDDKGDSVMNMNGTYSTREEAQAEKGDWYSGFRYVL